MCATPVRPKTVVMTSPLRTNNTQGFFVQAALSFGVSVSAVLIGIVYLPVDRWIRAFLGIGVLYVVTSSITLAKVVRDRQESEAVVNRVDQARLEKLLTDHDLFKNDLV